MTGPGGLPLPVAPRVLLDVESGMSQASFVPSIHPFTLAPTLQAGNFPLAHPLSIANGPLIANIETLLVRSEIEVIRQKFQ